MARDTWKRIDNLMQDISSLPTREISKDEKDSDRLISR